MKILELNLIAHGPFADSRIDLSGGKFGLHLIYGPNEAGKSSSLRAITDLLFGFPRRTPDDFLFSYAKLRVGGKLQSANGQILKVVRRKQGKTLRCPDDVNVIDDSLIANMMGDIDRDLFLSMFGIDHERLRSGGQQIAAGEGKVGAMLFAAGAGIVDLQRLQNGLQTEIDGLLKSSGRSGAIYKGIEEYRTIQKSIAEASVNVETWKSHQEELVSAMRRRKELDQQLRQLKTELDRLTHMETAIPIIARWKTRQESLNNLVGIPRLENEFERTANRLLTERSVAQSQRIDAQNALLKFDGQLKSLIVPDDLLAESDALEKLRDRIGKHQESLADRPVLLGRKETFDRELAGLLRDLEQRPELSVVDSLRLPPDKEVRIRALGSKLESLMERLQTHRKSCDRLRRSIQETESKRTDILVSTEVNKLKSTLQTVNKAGDVESELARTRQELAQLQSKINLAMSQLTRSGGSLKDLLAMEVPTSKRLNHIDDELKQAQSSQDTLRQRCRDEELNLADLDEELTNLELAQTIPTQAELEHWRQLREQGWQLVLQDWMKKIADESLLRDFLDQISTTDDLPSAYHHCVIEADRIADLIRNDAKRIATKTKLQSDRRQAAKRLANLTRQVNETDANKTAIRDLWHSLWSPLGIEPLSPDEMQDWLRQRESILQLSSQAQLKQLELEHLEQLIESQTRQLINALSSIDAETYSSELTVNELVDRLANRLAEFETAANQHTHLTAVLTSDREELAGAEAEYAETESQLKSLQSEWTTEMNVLGLDSNAIPEQANSRLTSLAKLIETFESAENLLRRIEDIDEDSQRFEADVRQLASRVAPELEKPPANVALKGMLNQLQEAKTIADRRRIALEQKSEQESRLRIADENLQRISALLDDMLRQAKVNEYESLNEIAQKSRERIEIEKALTELADQIAVHCGPSSLTEYVADVTKELSISEPIGQRVETLQASVDALNQGRDEVLGRIRSAEITLSKFDGNGSAAEQNASRASLAARLEEQLQSLAVLQVSATILAAGIERNRQKNQGPILGRASEIFLEITLGHFAGLRAEFNEKGIPVLVGVRGDRRSSAPENGRATLFDNLPEQTSNVGDLIPIVGMSEGTCDQLYLALRLASLESWLDSHDPVPFIVDDILLTFDDQRAAATLKILAELSRRTQVIFFTHHRHLVDLAQEHVAKRDLFLPTIEPVNAN